MKSLTGENLSHARRILSFNRVKKFCQRLQQKFSPTWPFSRSSVPLYWLQRLSGKGEMYCNFYREVQNSEIRAEF